MNCDNEVKQTAQSESIDNKNGIQTHNKQQQPTTSSLSSLHTIKYTKLTISINIIILLYYAMVSEVITTVAHGCAILLGLLLWKIALWIGDEIGYGR